MGGESPRLLLVDDDHLGREVLRDYLAGKGFTVEDAPGGEEALGLLDQGPPFDLLLADLLMPGMDGLALLRAVRERHPRVGVLMVTAVDDVGTAIDAIRLGALDYITKPVGLEELPLTLAKALEKKNLTMALAQFHREGRNQDPSPGTALDGLNSLVDILESKDTYSEGHCRRVGMFSFWLASEMGLTPEMCRRIRQAGLLHDLGKLLIAGPWLNQPGPLSEADRAVLREHPARGVDALREVLSPEEISFIAGHHERWDGRGYPLGVAGHRIPLGARIIAIADAFDAMTSQRSFRASRLCADALDEIERFGGTQFDPQLSRLFRSAIHRRLGETNG